MHEPRTGIGRNIEERPIASLEPYARNARTHSKKQLKQIAASIERFGFVNPVLIGDDDSVTGVAIGPGDISLELGGLAWNDPQVESILGDMAATINAAPDRALLRLAQSSQDAASHVKGGANMLILTHDVTLIREMYAEKFAALRGG
jgi:2-keto-3-deoxy-L-rhamnonate aldolase RhmA